jgi:DNA repair photolyase
MPLVFDQYSYCSHACAYCFAFYFKSSNPSLKTEQSKKLRAVNIENFKRIFLGKTDSPYYQHFFKNKIPLQWGSLADPFDTFERKNRVGLKFIRLFGEENYPVRFSFKGSTIQDYYEVFDDYKKQQNFAFMSSIISTDSKLTSKIEMGAPNAHKRFEMLGELTKMGYWTILRMRPFVLGMSDETLDELLLLIKQYNINAISIEFFALDLRCNEDIKLRYDWMSSFLGIDILDFYKKLSPTTRGTYLRLNRDIKEIYIRKIYKFCQENNIHFSCSDPDFKELNDSGSCCGLSDKEIGGLNNFVKNQLTNSLQKARKEFWRVNKPDNVLNHDFEDIFIDFNGVYGNNNSFLDDQRLYIDSIESFAEPTGLVQTSNLRIKLKEKWNNLRSPASPTNYFNKKVMPSHVSDGNIVYKYMPSAYELYWQIEEKINLTGEK